MSITFTEDISAVAPEGINALYGRTDGIFDLFENSFVRVIAIDGEISPNSMKNKLAGAIRVISEGVETALIVDLKAADGYGGELKSALVKEAEKKLAGRRVMVYGSREDLGLFEELGYGRCKNAWTYFRKGMNVSDFLPAGYRYENEFADPKTSAGAHNDPVSKKNRGTLKIDYRDGYRDTAFDDINTVLSKAFGGRPHDIKRTTAAFENSSHIITAFDGKKLVGVARAVSDGKGYATILNVAVDPEYQGLSIGKNMVLKLSESVSAGVIVLNTHPGAVGFYNKLKEYRRNKYVFEKFLRPEAGNSKENDEKTAKDAETRDEKAHDWAAAMFTPKGYRFPDEY